MADTKVTDFTDGTPAEAADEVYVNRGGLDRKVTAQSIGGLAFGAEVSEQSNPATPAANKGVLYFRDNGSGKTQICVRFPSGAIVVLATDA